MNTGTLRARAIVHLNYLSEYSLFHAVFERHAPPTSHHQPFDTGNLQGALGVYRTIRTLGGELGDMTEADFCWLLHVLCRSEAYADLKEVLLTMGDDLSELSEDTVSMLRAFFAGPLGEAACHTSAAMSGAQRSEGWDVSEVQVDTAVRTCSRAGLCSHVTHARRTLRCLPASCGAQGIAADVSAPSPNDCSQSRLCHGCQLCLLVEEV